MSRTKSDAPPDPRRVAAAAMTLSARSGALHAAMLAGKMPDDVADAQKAITDALDDVARGAINPTPAKPPAKPPAK